MGIIDWIQTILNFHCCQSNPVFKDSRGIGRIAVASFLLGNIIGLHFAVLIYSTVFSSPCWLVRWSLYLVSLAFFHFMEFLSTALYKPEAATYDSFMLNHSKEYTVAILAAWIEFWIELLIFPSFKQCGNSLSLILGSILLFGGQFCRIIAMHTAKSNFSHTIMDKKEQGHQLVTHGIYSILRHPSYCGWFWWVVGSQIILMNPLCLLAYTLVSWKFFESRIRYEEATLCNFYPQDYSSYRAKTTVGIPFIR